MGVVSANNLVSTEVLSAIGDAVVAAQVDGTIFYVNPAAEQLYGYGPGELVGKSLEVLIDGVHQAEGRAIFQALARGQSWTGEFQVRRRDGSRFLAQVTDTPMMNAAGELTGVIGVSRDLTRQRQVEARLMTADRMASVGTLAAGVAHELNNPLAYVTSNLRFLSDELTDLAALEAEGRHEAFAERISEMRRSIEDAADGADRMRVIIRDLKTLCRSDEAGTRPLELARVVEAAARLTSSAVLPRAKLVHRFGDAPRVMANESHLGQVLVNLLHNAALSFDGRAAGGEPSIELSIETDADGSARIDVRDNGCGIAPEHQRRIFDPFFTTRPVGTGTGLGLSVAHALVTRMGGTIEVQSELGRGTTFTLRFPAAPSMPAGEPAIAPR